MAKKKVAKKRTTKKTSKKKGAVQRLPLRSETAVADTWDLSELYDGDKAWEKAFKRWSKQIEGYTKFQGNLADPEVLAECLKFDERMDRIGQKLGNYAFLRTAEDAGNADAQQMFGLFMNIATKASELSSYIRPELLSLPQHKLRLLLEDRRLKRYRLMLSRLIRQKPHTLGKKEEHLLAMQGEMSRSCDEIFRQLTDVDFKFPTVKDEKGRQVELSHGAYSTLLHSEDRKVRREAFTQYYGVYQSHENTLAATLAGSVQRDAYYARARNHDSSLAMALFPDNVPQTVYEGLIDSVHRHLPALHRYYDLRRRKMKLRDIHAYDTYVPILSDLQVERDWSDATELIIESLTPLGCEYQETLKAGLVGRWCDRYENRGKTSGAFCCGGYDGHPFILMNYKPTVLEDVFTLTHESGHAMHSFYSSKKQTFPYHDYVIFVAEVASTFNEQLLSRYMLDQATDDRMRAMLVNRQIDAIRGTIFRQTMFAEFEKLTHESIEAGQPLTTDRFKQMYNELLKVYFGPDFALDPQLDIECFRIPHFYRAFYVYKYATGLSAAIALADRVLGGGKSELTDYLGFLGGGCSKDPLDLLRGAGVDMETPEPIDKALDGFADLVDKLDELL